MPNRLSDATSPYLLQHQDNPVDWWPWCDEAFDEAKRRDVPVFLSIGYAACHWCHVMAHESFEDDETAALMNREFVNIKVDREERPDVDAVYMAAVQGLTGHGGWPMSVFLNLDRQPFHAGTYFPPEPQRGMPSFTQVLSAVSDAWIRRRLEIDDTAGKVATALADQQLVRHLPPTGSADAGELADTMELAVQRLMHDFDPVNAGFGTAPKFPPSTVLEFLLRHARRTGTTESLKMVTETCNAMARGGIYDQLAGGFARYSVDAGWVVPHFEKMLYDNAQLLRIYAHLYAATDTPSARRVCEQTAQFLLRDLRTEQGGFASALDADAPIRPGGPSSEGSSYVWTPGELAEVLGEQEGELAAQVFGVTDTGTFEHGASVLQLRHTPDLDWLDASRAKLLAARDERPQPARDDKVVAAWNGLAVAALADAGSLLDRQDWIDAAVECATLLLGVHVTSDESGGIRLARVSRDGIAAPHAAGTLDDYGDVCEGLLTLYSVVPDARWLTTAGGLLETVLRHFQRPEGGFFDAADDAESLIIRPCDPTDLAAASGWSAVTNALLTYGTLMASPIHLNAAAGGLRIAGQLGRTAPRFAGWLLAAAEASLDGPFEVVIVGQPDDPATQDLLSAARQTQRPGMTVVAAAPNTDNAPGPFQGRVAVDGRPTAYVCRGTFCHEPVTTAEELGELLR